MEVLNDEYVCMEYDQESNILKTVWKPATEKFSDTIYKTEFESFVKMVLKYCPKAIFVDIRTMYYCMSPEIQAWTDEMFTLPGYKCGVRKIAFLASPDIFTQVSLENSVDLGLKEKIETQYFDYIDKAQEWLGI
jgi:hypothetical protein